MEEVRYMISDAANMLHVESHVLRYWEEELELDIPRNEMGHRYYTEENIRQFEQIRKLKDEGYQLKAIKMLVHNQNPDVKLVTPQGQEQHHEELNLQKEDDKGALRLEQFRQLMAGIVKQAIAENNQSLSHEIGSQVEERVIKEMNYLMREREEQEEERYRKLDEAIRLHQKRGHRPKREKKLRMKKKDRTRMETKESPAG